MQIIHVCLGNRALFGLKGSGKTNWVKNNEQKINECYNLVYNMDDFYECDFFNYMSNKN